MPKVEDEIMSAAVAHEQIFVATGLSAEPTKHLAVVTCMDARIDPLAILNLSPGEAHIIRNAGGVVTQDTIRSLMLSQHLLGTTDIVLMHHTDCGLEGRTEEDVADHVSARTGARPHFEVETFRDVDESVRRSIERIHASALVRDQHLRGFVYDVTTGHLRQVR